MYRTAAHSKCGQSWSSCQAFTFTSVFPIGFHLMDRVTKTVKLHPRSMVYIFLVLTTMSMFVWTLGPQFIECVPIAASCRRLCRLCSISSNATEHKPLPCNFPVFVSILIKGGNRSFSRVPFVMWLLYSKLSLRYIMFISIVQQLWPCSKIIIIIIWGNVPLHECALVKCTFSPPCFKTNPRSQDIR